jgi:ABC-type antimicrobial peptide transport system permease subunit
LGIALNDSAVGSPDQFSTVRHGNSGLLSAATVRLLRGFLYGLSPFDPVAFFAASLAWIAIAMIASWYPARRATRVDPMTALNYE